MPTGAADAARRLRPRPPREPGGDRRARDAGAAAPLPRPGGRCTTPPTRRSSGSLPARRGCGSRRELVETDLVVVVSAAETVLHGGPATLLAAADAETQRRATAESLLETGGSEGWRLATLVEQTLAARVPLFGVSLVLNHPQFAGLLRGYPYEPGGRRAHRALAAAARLLGRAGAGPSPRAPLAARRRGRRRRCSRGRRPSRTPRRCSARSSCGGRRLDEPLDALVIGIPGTTPFLPREQPNPLLAAHLGLAHALGLWRDAFPVARRRHRHPRPPLPAHLPAADAAAVPRLLPLRPDRARPGAAERRGGGRRRGRARGRGVPRRAHRPSAAAVPRLGGVPARARAARRRLRRGRARRRRGAAARLRPDRRDRRGAPDGPRPPRPRRAHRLPARAAVLPAARRLRRSVGRGTSAAAAISSSATSSAFTDTSRSADAARSNSVTFSHCDSNVDHQRSPAASACFSCSASACGCVTVRSRVATLDGRSRSRRSTAGLVEVDELGRRPAARAPRARAAGRAGEAGPR